MEIIRHGSSFRTVGWLGQHTCRDCGCIFNLTIDDTVEYAGGDTFFKCPECGKSVCIE